MYKLNLKEQKKIFSARLAEMRLPMGGPGMPHMAKDSAEELQKAAASKEKKLKKILTKEQFAKWQKMRDEQKPPRRPHNNAEAPQKDKI